MAWEQRQQRDQLLSVETSLGIRGLPEPSIALWPPQGGPQRVQVLGPGLFLVRGHRAESPQIPPWQHHHNEKSPHKKSKTYSIWSQISEAAIV